MDAKSASSSFGKALSAVAPHERSRRTWLFVPYDQLSDRIGPLSTQQPEDLGIVLVENPGKAARRPYHRQKIALVLANLRHFAIEQAERGVAVRHVVHPGNYADALRPLAEELGPLQVMEPAERELRVDLAPLVDEALLEIVPHTGWLTTEDQFQRHRRHPPWRMDAFYKLVRQETGILMDGDEPLGGKFSFDTENREPWKGEPPAASPPTFEADAITLEVCELVERAFPGHPGRIDPAALPASKAQAIALWRWARQQCLEHFGTYEDAMSAASTTLFHTRLSSLLHLHRLLPREVLEDVVAMDLPLNSKEGFVRQLLGWREFMRHVHRETDGFRSLPGRDGTRTTIRPREAAGDGGFARWKGADWPAEGTEGWGGAAPSRLESRRGVPPALWGTPSGLHCLDTVVASVWDEAYSHHITRLMVVANLGTLLDWDPRELTDWFWCAYTDAYDWVVEPNVLGMGTFAVGDLFTTKPYVSGAAYIDRMSDYCDDCAFHPKKSCPITRLYWAFLNRHRDQLEGNPRLTMPLRTAERRSENDRSRDEATFDVVSRTLARGGRITPEELREKTS